MKNCQILLYHIAGNSTSYSIIILGTITALYEVWIQLEKIKKNIVVTVVYAVLFVLSVFEIIDIPIMTLCCLKERVRQAKLISALKDINGILSYALRNSGPNDVEFLKMCEEQFSILRSTMDEIKEKLEKIKNQENSAEIIIIKENMHLKK